MLLLLRWQRSAEKLVHSLDFNEFYFSKKSGIRAQLVNIHTLKLVEDFIVAAFKMAKKLNNNVLKIAQYAKQYIEQKLEYLPINMARWMSQI